MLCDSRSCSEAKCINAKIAPDSSDHNIRPLIIHCILALVHCLSVRDPCDGFDDGIAHFFPIDDGGQLFQGGSRCFHEEEVNDDKLDKQPGIVYNVVYKWISMNASCARVRDNLHFYLIALRAMGFAY